MTNKAVWVVDDERSIRWVLEKALTQEGLAVTCFDTAESLLSNVSASPPDAVVSDIRMPGKDGLDLLSELKDRYPSLPVVIMTTKVTPSRVAIPLTAQMQVHGNSSTDIQL